MPHADPLGLFEQLLEQERDAIRRLDSEAVLGIAEKKLEAMPALAALQASVDVRQRMTRVVKELRRNAVLLAHARESVRELLVCLTGSAGTYGAKGEIARPDAGRGRRVSITG